MTGLESDLPPHKYSQSGFLDAYDAAKYCGDYALGKQKAYACAACYSIKLPAEAQTGTKAKVEAILASVYGDRWLAEGAILSAFLTDSATPPAWATIVETASPTYLASRGTPRSVGITETERQFIFDRNFSQRSRIGCCSYSMATINCTLSRSMVCQLMSFQVITGTPLTLC